VTIRNNRKSFLAAAIILCSIMSFSLPRETFDPHCGVDTDIFCRAYFQIISDLYELDLSVSLFEIVEKNEPANLYCPEYRAEIDRANSTRAPPGTILPIAAA
jgi:ABC-type antimicrobial peptide transport system permease subunit